MWLRFASRLGQIFNSDLTFEITLTIVINDIIIMYCWEGDPGHNELNCGINLLEMWGKGCIKVAYNRPKMAWAL